MMPKAAKKPTKPEPEPEVDVHNVSKFAGTLQAIGGSRSDDWNSVLAIQTLSAIRENSDAEQVERQRSATVAALVGIGPKDEIEGMIAAQLIACHAASMECFRIAMYPEQNFDARHENLKQATKLSRTYAILLEALNRHRGKGQQKVTVEHVHVHAGGQAVVGMIETPGDGDQLKPEDQAHAKQIAHAPQPTLWSADKEREPVPIASDAERPLQDARRHVPGRSEG
jgi:hypothetical protein